MRLHGLTPSKNVPRAGECRPSAFGFGADIHPPLGHYSTMSDLASHVIVILSSPGPGGLYRYSYKLCGNKCDSCDKFVWGTDRIVSAATGKSYWIRKNFICQSQYVIYCATCTLCRKQGVGSTFIWKPQLSTIVCKPAAS